MAKSAKRRAAIEQQKLRRNILLVSLLVLLAKFIVILSVRNGGWLGADGESYLKGVDALMKDGFLSKQSVLTYWPAGYPLLIWVLTFVSVSKLVYLLSFVQTIIYFVASLFFVDQIRTTRLSRLALPLALILGLNPTLSLSSVVIGYESLVASCLLITAGLILRYQKNKSKKNLTHTLILVGLVQSVSAFVQPRGILIGLGILVVWAVATGSRRSAIAVTVIGFCAMMILPATLVLRNIQANDLATISTNLGVTMNIGAGDKATGGYPSASNAQTGVPCKPTPPATSASDGQLIKCVLIWYVKHPVKTLVLALKKSEYFWSPWSGPLVNGTMARNPWLNIDPIHKIAISSKQGHDLVFGWFGRLISWVWELSGVLLFILGVRWLWEQGGLERQTSLLAGVPVGLAWLTAIGTIGDHRFRLPTLGLSLFLQLAGWFGLRARLFRDG